MQFKCFSEGMIHSQIYKSYSSFRKIQLRVIARNFYRPRMREGNVFMLFVCVSVCVCVCVCSGYNF